MPITPGINLFPSTKPTLEQSRTSARFRKWAVFILMGYVCYTAIIFGVGTFYNLQIAGVKNKANQVVEAIKKQQKKESLELTLKGRMQEITKIMAARIDYTQRFLRMERFSSDGLTFTGVDFSSANAVSLSGTAQDVKVLVAFLDRLKTETPDFFGITLSSLSRGKEGTYGFSLSMVLK